MHHDRGAMPSWLPLAMTIGLATLGLGLAVDSALQSSSTYDETTYLIVAAQWWRDGTQDTLTRMGSPSLFWKVQQVVPLWALDRAGFGVVLEDPERYQAILLPLVRLSCIPIWAVAMAVTSAWARSLYGPRAMVMAAALFALSPNLIAHAPLATMETPLIACSAGLFACFWRFLASGQRRWLAFSAVLTGVAFSCKYTTILFPPMLACLWWVGERGDSKLRRFLTGSFCFAVCAVGTNLAVTGFSFTPLSPNQGQHGSIDSLNAGSWKLLAGRILETPVPREIAGFAAQMRIQRQGGSSYLFGERRERGWLYYYLVTLVYKVTPGFWALLLARCLLASRGPYGPRDGMIPVAILCFLTITLLGSSRNFGLRYLLPLAPLAIVWVSALAESGRVNLSVAALAILFQAISIGTTHPHELSYFPRWVGGTEGGRRILSDSNLDWGQGLKSLARLQMRRPEYNDLTLYYFGDTDPKGFGVVGKSYVIDASSHHPLLPSRLEARSRYLAVSSSLQFGPWGPASYFRLLDGIRPVRFLEDGTMALYRVQDIPGLTTQ